MDVPEGESGDWAVQKFEITKDGAMFWNMNPTSGARPVFPGHYTRLTRLGSTIMSDTRAEIADCLPFIFMSKGRVLINGLGLGVVLQAVLRKTEVTHATVIEQSEDVLKLVAEHYKQRFGKRLNIIHADAYTYRPPKGEMYDAVWHDIWDDITPDNLPLMAKLHRKYGRRTPLQGSWCRSECVQMRRAERAYDQLRIWAT